MLQFWKFTCARCQEGQGINISLAYRQRFSLHVPGCSVIKTQRQNQWTLKELKVLLE